MSKSSKQSEEDQPNQPCGQEEEARQQFSSQQRSARHSVHIQGQGDMLEMQDFVEDCQYNRVPQLREPQTFDPDAVSQENGSIEEYHYDIN